MKIKFTVWFQWKWTFNKDKFAEHLEKIEWSLSFSFSASSVLWREYIIKLLLNNIIYHFSPRSVIRILLFILSSNSRHYTLYHVQPMKRKYFQCKSHYRPRRTLKYYMWCLLLPRHVLVLFCITEHHFPKAAIVLASLMQTYKLVVWSSEASHLCAFKVLCNLK